MVPNVPQLKSLQASLVKTKFGNQEVLLGMLYLSPSKLHDPDINFTLSGCWPHTESSDKQIVLEPNKKFIVRSGLNSGILS